MRVARRQHRTVREQSVQSSALKARLQQKAVARPYARVVNSIHETTECIHTVGISYSYFTQTHVRVPGFPFKGIARGRLQEERDSW